MNVRIRDILRRIGVKPSMKDPAEIRKLGDAARNYQRQQSPPKIGTKVDRRA